MEKPPPAQIPTVPAGRKWVVAVVLFWMIFVTTGVYASYGAFFNPLLAYLHVSRAKLALLPTLVVMVASVVGPAIGWLLDRVEGRWVVSVGLVLMCLGMLLCAGAHSFTTLFWGALILSFGWGGSSAVVIGTLISRWFTTGRGLAMGVAFSGSALGASALLQVSGYVIRHFGWRWAYIALSVPALLLLPLALLFLGNPPAQASVEPAPATYRAAASAAAGLEVAQAIRARSFWIVSLAMIIYWFDSGVLYVHAVPQLIALGVGSARAVTTVSLGLLLAAAAKPVFGGFSDKFGVEKMLTLCLVGSAVGCFALVRGNEMPYTALFVAGFMLFNVPIMLFPTIAAEVYGLRRYGTLWGFNIALCLIGQSLGPALAGATFDKYGTYTPILVLCGVLALLAAALPFGCVRFSATVAAPTVEASAISS